MKQFRILTFDPISFGEALRKFREARKLTLRTVQKQTSVHFKTISHTELGKSAGLATILLAFWADLDLNDYVEVNHPTKDLFGNPIIEPHREE